MKVGKGARMPSSAVVRVALRGGNSRMRASALLHELALELEPVHKPMLARNMIPEIIA